VNQKPLILNIFKPPGPTSAKVVGHFKYHLKKNNYSVSKIGHLGTLDPFAGGVLLLAMNGGSRISDLLHEHAPKTYISTGILGIQTDTLDCEGEVVKVDDCDHLKTLSLSEVQKALESKFKGEYLQAPPSFSACKHQGKALYKWAREGIEIKKEAKLRHIYQFKILRYVYPYLSFEVTVSSGTYIRSLFMDMAFELGTVGHLKSLVRTSIGKLNMGNALKKGQWPSDLNGFDLYKNSIAMDEALDFEKLTLSESQYKKYRNGVACSMELPSRPDPYWVYGPNNELCGPGVLKDQVLKPIFNTPHQS
jgi:tRNA pseudouridine55 synthase